jgi:phosphoenolpyruvate carboxylase
MRIYFIFYRVMSQLSSAALQEFKNHVALNSSCTTAYLPHCLFTALKKRVCCSLCSYYSVRKVLVKTRDPTEIITNFLQQNTSYDKEEERIDLLFRFVQYAERQVGFV